EGQYAFELPPQIDSGWLDVRVGDLAKRILLEPTLRPELKSVEAQLAFPPYLGRTQSVKKDVRGGAVSLVKSSRATFTATATGGPDKELVELAGTFSATSLGIEPQPIQVRLFAEDFFPGRQRVYSPPYILYVLNAEQHAIWITEQLSKWHRQSLEVRDREMQ